MTAKPDYNIGRGPWYSWYIRDADIHGNDPVSKALYSIVTKGAWALDPDDKHWRPRPAIDPRKGRYPSSAPDWPDRAQGDRA